MSEFKFELERGSDRLKVEILADGSVKIETDAVSAANHGTAENFLRNVFSLCGGRTEITHKRPLALVEGGHGHSHHHH